jgi:hypothetical protein
MKDSHPEIHLVGIHRVHPAVLPPLHLVAPLHLLLDVRPLALPLVQIRIAAAKICRRVVAQVIVAAQLEM